MKTTKLTVLFLAFLMLVSMPAIVSAEEIMPDTAITVPEGANVLLTQKDFVGKNYKPFTEVIPAATVSNEGGTNTLYFEIEEGKTCNVRISGENYITYADTFTKEGDFSLVVTENELSPEDKSSKTIVRDTTANNCHNVADIYLNINPQGFLKMESGSTYQLMPQRVWQAVNSVTDNYFMQPDYNYQVIDENGESSSDVVSVSDDGLITAVGSGTAIVLVTYDAFIYPSAILADETPEFAFFGAIWPENTGVFVVSVGAEEGNIDTGMTLNGEINAEDGLKSAGDALDAEHDIIYFTGDEGSYTFTPKTEGCTVSVANPLIDSAMTFSGFDEVTANEDGSFSAVLKEGRNIVKITNDGKSEYQVITAKKVSFQVNGGETVKAGDSLNIVFDKIYHPINKLDGVYNMSAQPIYTEVSGYENALIGGEANQYSFANNEQAQSVSSILTEVDNWGVINYEKSEELIVPSDYDEDVFTLKGGMIYCSGWGFPGITHRTLTKDFVGAEGFASAQMGWFCSLPDIEIPIYKEPDMVKEISVTTMPTKTQYKSGEIFDASGMVVTATYESGKTEVISDYIISPDRALVTNDTEIEIIYTGENAGDEPVSVKINILVTSAGNRGGSSSASSLRAPISKDEDKQEVEDKEESEKEEEVKTPEKSDFSEKTFSDIKEDDWYFDAVKYVYENNLMQGTDKEFKPMEKMTRALLVQVLYRLEGTEEKITFENTFNDVENGAWYEESVLWAAENKIVVGISDDIFAPDEHISREQMAVILCRYAKMKGMNISSEETMGKFEDTNEISDWAHDAVLWANSISLINGTDDGRLLPKGTATRAQFATVLMRFCQTDTVKGQ